MTLGPVKDGGREIKRTQHKGVRRPLYVFACEMVRLMNVSISDIDAGASACGRGGVTEGPWGTQTVALNSISPFPVPQCASRLANKLCFKCAGSFFFFFFLDSA